MFKMFKKFFSYIFSVVFVYATMSSVNAYAVEIDNDDRSGFSNQRNGFSTCLSSSNHFRDNARRDYNTANGNYIYEFNGSGKSSSGSFQVSMYAYLNDASFTNPKARYAVHGNLYPFDIGIKNQDTASGGWNYIGSTTVAPLIQLGYTSITVNSAGVYTNGSNRYTGADGVRIYF